VLLSAYYLLCSYLLKPFISLKNIKYKEIFTPSVGIGIILVMYLTFAILDLVLSIFEDAIYNMILIVISLFYYLGCCFIIFLDNRYTYAFYLLIAASSCILVNTLVPIHELYYRNSLFGVVINVMDIVAMLFYLKFLIQAEPLQKTKGSEFF